MKPYLCVTVVVLGLIATPIVVEARGGGYGGHFHGGGWHGGRFTYKHHHNNHYYGGCGYGPSYYTGGAVGYYNIPARCRMAHIYKGPNNCYGKRFCRRH